MEVFKMKINWMEFIDVSEDVKAENSENCCLNLQTDFLRF